MCMVSFAMNQKPTKERTLQMLSYWKLRGGDWQPRTALFGQIVMFGSNPLDLSYLLCFEK